MARTTASKSTARKVTSGRKAPTTMARRATPAEPKAATKATAKRAGKVAPVAEVAQPRPSKRFTTAEHPDVFTCAGCGEERPVTAFPTVAGPAVRGTTCRRCRDEARAV